MTHRKVSILTFSPQEKKDLIVSWLTLSLAFAVMINPIFFNITSFIISLPIALVAVGTGFVLHELAHREAAKSFGFHSEFRAWYGGLALAVGLAIVTQGQFLFAAPGATYFIGENVTRKQNGIISAAGPITNLVIGIILLIIGSQLEGFFQTTLVYAAIVNFMFAAFNLLPFFVLDGTKVIAWKPLLWAALIFISGLLALMPQIVLIPLGIKGF
ncbi:MAG: site-2 protease family protein [archaeon]|jgi:Zn-dependent protease